MEEEIKHAAIKTISGFILIGKSHADCYHKAENIGLGKDLTGKADHQGFMTSNGRYVTREEAAKITIKSKQREFVAGGILCSEDLWSEEHGGKYVHDEIKGYILK